MAVDFFQEDITLTVSCSTATVHAVYWFRNRYEREIQFPVLYPLPVDEHHPYPDTVCVHVGEEPLPFTHRRDRDAVQLTLRLPARDVLPWSVDYTQRLVGSRARYILTTTSAWARPFEEARYRFVVPVSFEDVRTWPEPDSLSVEGGLRTLWCRKRDFLPERDMTIEWRSSAGP